MTRYYLAAAGMLMTDYPDFDMRHEGQFHELRSYWELRKFTGHTLPIFGRKDTYFMDSGAFSARTQGFDLSPIDYGNFIKRYSDQIPYFANLDVIPKRGYITVNQAAKRTKENQRILEDLTGRVPLPVYHKAEPIEFLDEYLENYEYICIGGLMNQTITERQCFDVVFEKNKKYNRKLHAFGLANNKMLRRYPWLSADSSSWLMQAKIGIIVIPRERNGEYDYSQSPIAMPISDKCAGRSWYGLHFETKSEYEKDYVRKYLEHLNVEFNSLLTYAQSRHLVNLHYWIEFGKTLELNGRQVFGRQISLL
jgi:hypothetical protein